MHTKIEKKATLYRMVLPNHICPYGLKSKNILLRKGYLVEEHLLTTREQVDLFKEKHGVQTTPQTFIGDKRIGGYDDLRRYFGKKIANEQEKTYRPVVVLFMIAALMALATSYASYGSPFSTQALVWFVSFSMTLLALLKLQDVEAFSTMFLNYDLLARRWVPYSYIYPFAEALAGILMISGALNWISIPIALCIGTIGSISVFKAVYIDKRELRCACVGGSSNVPLGFISLTENIMMVGMATCMLII